MNYYLIDNQRYSLLQFFQDNSVLYNNLSIATGYIDLYGLQQILPLLNNYSSIRILIGQEPLIRRYNKTQVEPDFPILDFTNDLQEIPLEPKFTETIKLVKQLINEGKLEIKVFKKTFLHAKCYIFTNHSIDKKLENAVGIIGSSNLTGNGISGGKNIELNHVEHNEMIVKYPANANEPNLIGHYAWFNELWNSDGAINWSGQFTELLDLSPVGELMYSPYEMYIKTLWELYQNELDEAGQQISQGYQLYEYQLKNANSLCKKLEKRGLALLCDSVGLGKTITALEVVMRYFTNGKRIVIICPKSLKNQWEHASRKQGLNIDVISLQNEKELEENIGYDRYAPVGLFIIDESHNLRNGATSSRFERVRGWISKNKTSHCLLLTATPINNSISDLLNQILLGSGGNADVLLVPTENGMRNVVDVINSIRKSEGQMEEITPDLLARRRAKLHPIIKEFVVRRTRQGILQEQSISNFEPKLQFPEDILESRSYVFDKNMSSEIILKTKQLSTSFNANAGDLINRIYAIPEFFQEYDDEAGDCVEKTLDDKLIYLKHPIDQLELFKYLLSEKKVKESSPLRLIYQIIQFLGFIPYRYMLYHHNFYGKSIEDIKEMPITDERIVLNRQKGLYGLFRVLFLKRLESSFYALQISLENYKDTLNKFKESLNKGVLLPISQLLELIEQYGEDYNIDNINSHLDSEIKPVNLNDFNQEQLRLDIEKELLLIQVLELQLEILNRNDSKIKELSELFKELNLNLKHYNKGKPKVLVFSYFADTIRYLKDNFAKHFTYKSETCEFISSSNRTSIDDITRRFAPNGKDYRLQDEDIELQYLFATDVLSEGQNLQDCAILINYDLHWNPVRMIQRNGRINRIGSEYDKVYIYNMHPHSQLEEYLKLVKRLEYKIGLIRDIVGQDQRVLRGDEKLNPIEFIDDIEIKKLQMLYSSDSLQSQNIFNELANDGEYLTDDKFITDLRYFHEKHKNNHDYTQQIYSIPKGKFGQTQNLSNQLLILTQMNDANDNKLFNKFFTVKGNSPEMIDDLIALQMIRTDEQNNQRSYSELYKIYLQYLSKNYVGKLMVALQTSSHERTLDTGQQNLRTKIMRLLIETSYPQESRTLLDQALLFSNYSEFNLIQKQIKKIIKAPNSKDINKLLGFCKTSINDVDLSPPIIQPSSCEGLLYYAN